MATATLPLRVHKPEQLDDPATVNGVRPTDYVSYSRPLGDGTWFVIVRDGQHNNPRTLILTSAQLNALDRRPILSALAKVAAVLLLLCSPATAADVVSEDAEWVSSGQGVAVAADTIATAAHVVEHGSIRVDGRPARLLCTEGDVAWLYVQGVKGQPVGSKPALGESVTIHAKARVIRGTMLTENVYVTQPIRKGDSGSAVMYRGKVVGVITHRVGDAAACVEWIGGPRNGR